MSTKQLQEQGVDSRSSVRGPYVNRVHYGYLGRFKDRVVTLFHELAEHGIQDYEIQQWEIDPPQAVRAETGGHKNSVKRYLRAISWVGSETSPSGIWSQ